jgi:hypothetical protein
LESLRVRDHSEDIDGGIILNRSLGNSDRGCGLDSSGSGQGPVTGSCEHGNEPSNCIKGGKFD